MEITITAGTNAKSQRVTRVRVEISDRELALIDGDPDNFLKVIKRSRNAASDRLNALTMLAGQIEAGARRAKR